MNSAVGVLPAPSVGIVVPCFNQGQFIGECVASLEAQFFVGWRAVVVDDASNDGVTPSFVDEVKSPRVEVVHLARNVGVCEARNEGFRRLSDLPFHMALDADDLLEPGYIQALLDRLAAAETVGAAYGTKHAFGASKARPTGWKWPRRPFDRAKRYDEPFLPEAGVLFRTAALEETQGWRREFSSLAEGWDLTLQLIDAAWTVDWVEDAVYHYRRHENAVTENWTKEKSARVDALLLKYHARGIAEEVGVRRFLGRRVTPAVKVALRDGKWRAAWQLLGPALAGAPFETTLSLLEALSRWVFQGRREA